MKFNLPKVLSFTHQAASALKGFSKTQIGNTLLGRIPGGTVIGPVILDTVIDLTKDHAAAHTAVTGNADPAKLSSDAFQNMKTAYLAESTNPDKHTIAQAAEFAYHVYSTVNSAITSNPTFDLDGALKQMQGTSGSTINPILNLLSTKSLGGTSIMFGGTGFKEVEGNVAEAATNTVGGTTMTNTAGACTVQCNSGIAASASLMAHTVENAALYGVIPKLANGTYDCGVDLILKAPDVSDGAAVNPMSLRFFLKTSLGTYSSDELWQQSDVVGGQPVKVNLPPGKHDDISILVSVLSVNNTAHPINVAVYWSIPILGIMKQAITVGGVPITSIGQLIGFVGDLTTIDFATSSSGNLTGIVPSILDLLAFRLRLAAPSIENALFNLTDTGLSALVEAIGFDPTTLLNAQQVITNPSVTAQSWDTAMRIFAQLIFPDNPDLS
jgi:hypothetical protein